MDSYNDLVQKLENLNVPEKLGRYEVVRWFIDRCHNQGQVIVCDGNHYTIPGTNFDCTISENECSVYVDSEETGLTKIDIHRLNDDSLRVEAIGKLRNGNPSEGEVPSFYTLSYQIDPDGKINSVLQDHNVAMYQNPLKRVGELPDFSRTTVTRIHEGYVYDYEEKDKLPERYFTSTKEDYTDSILENLGNVTSYIKAYGVQAPYSAQSVYEDNEFQEFINSLAEQNKNTQGEGPKF